MNGSGVASLITATPAGQPLVVRAIYGGSENHNNAVLPGTENDATPAYLPTGMVIASLNPFDGFTGGASLAVGDFNGDGVDDIAVGAGPGGGPRITVFDVFHNTILFNGYAFGDTFSGGVSLAAGDVDGDGMDDLIVGAGPGGGPRVVVFSPGQGWAMTQSFYAYDPGFTGGVSVAAGPLFNANNDGACNVIVGAGPTGGPQVVVFDFKTGQPKQVASFWGADPADRGGVNVAAVTGTWCTGQVAVASARPDGVGAVRLFTVDASAGDGVEFGSVSLGAQPAGLALAGGGFDYPGVPILLAGAPGAGGVTVFGVQGEGSFYTRTDFNTNIGGKIAINITPPNPSTLAFLPTVETGTVVTQPLGGQTVAVVSGFVPLTMMPPPPRFYHTPYTLLPIPEDLIKDFSEGDRADPSKWADFVKPTGEDWGPKVTTFEVTKAIADMSATEQAQRLVAAAELLMNMGTDYQHHHTPGWLPDPDAPWVPNYVMIKQTPGVDCSNFIAFIYNFALGFDFTATVSDQANLTGATQHISDGDDRDVAFSVTTLPDGATDPANIEASYDSLLTTLQPGDLLYIDGTSPNDQTASSAGHVIMWLGSLAEGDTPLVIDCTGPEHIDANGIHPPEGVQIRPFELTGVNSWYIHDLLSYTRILPTSGG